MAEWSRSVDTRLINWCCSVSMSLVQIPGGLLNFQTYIYIYTFNILL